MKESGREGMGKRKNCVQVCVLELSHTHAHCSQYNNPSIKQSFINIIFIFNLLASFIFSQSSSEWIFPLLLLLFKFNLFVKILVSRLLPCQTYRSRCYPAPLQSLPLSLTLPFSLSH